MGSVASLRIDDETEAALAELGDAYGNRTETLKTAILTLVESKRRQAIRAQAVEAANDPEDRAEMAAVLAEMEALGEG